MKAREWKMQDDALSEMWMIYDGPMGKGSQDIVTIREVLPDQITISREDLRLAMEKCWQTINVESVFQPHWLQRELFDRPLTSDAKGG